MVGIIITKLIENGKFYEIPDSLQFAIDFCWNQRIGINGHYFERMKKKTTIFFCLPKFNTNFALNKLICDFQSSLRRNRHLLI